MSLRALFLPLSCSQIRPPSGFPAAVRKSLESVIGWREEETEEGGGNVHNGQAEKGQLDTNLHLNIEDHARLWAAEKAQSGYTSLTSMRCWVHFLVEQRKKKKSRSFKCLSRLKYVSHRPDSLSSIPRTHSGRTEPRTLFLSLPHGYHLHRHLMHIQNHHKENKNFNMSY